MNIFLDTVRHASDVAKNKGIIEHEYKEWKDIWTESPCISSWV